MDLMAYFNSLRTGDYQLDNFKSFLKHTKFSYNIPSIHVAGTNGKGSTCNYLASIYRAHGLKVGLYVSPYLNKFNEAITINGQEISDEDIEKYIKNAEKFVKKYDLSAFELQTYICFKYFEDQKCDIAIIECGMGGELDATNIFDPILSIITSISLEHTSFLGRSMSEIALHKAGIIKQDVPVVIGQIEGDALKVITDTALENESKIFTKVEPGNVSLEDDGYHFTYLTYKDLYIQSKGLYSVNDACIAIEAVHAINNKINVTNEEICKGLKEVKMPCRMDFVRESPNILIDGAHNPEGMICLKNAIERVLNGRNLRVVFACFRDKNLQAMLATIGELADELILTTFDNPRAREMDEYFLFADDYKCMENPVEAIKYFTENYPSDLILITGSLAFAAYCKSLFEKGAL